MATDSEMQIVNPIIDMVYVASVNLGKICLQAFNIKNGTCIKSFRGVSVAPNTLCPVGPKDYFIGGQKDRPLLQVWAINQNDSLPMRFNVPGRVGVMAVSQSQQHYCALGVEDKIYIYYINSGCQFSIINKHYQDITCLEFTSCGNYLISAAEDGFVYVWSMFSLREALHKLDKPQIDPYYILGQHSDKVTGLSLCGFGMRGFVVSCSLDRSAKVFDLASGLLRHTVVAPVGLTAVAASSLGTQLFFAGQNGTVWPIDLVSQNHSENIELGNAGTKCHTSEVHHMSVTGCGGSLVTGSADGEARVWSVVKVRRRNAAHGALSVLPQRLLASGKGAITNMIITSMDPEVFNLSKLKSRVLLTPFTIEGDVLSTPSFHCAPNAQSPISAPENESALMIRIAAQLLDKKITADETDKVDDYDASREVPLASEDLYRRRLKQILGK